MGFSSICNMHKFLQATFLFSVTCMQKGLQLHLHATSEHSLYIEKKIYSVVYGANKEGACKDVHPCE